MLLSLNFHINTVIVMFNSRGCQEHAFYITRMRERQNSSVNRSKLQKTYAFINASTCTSVPSSRYLSTTSMAHIQMSLSALLSPSFQRKYQSMTDAMADPY